MKRTADGLRDRVAVTGIGESEFSSGGGNTAERLILTACRRAVADAGLEPGDVDGILVDSYHGEKTIAPDALAETLGIDRRFSTPFLGGGGGTANVGSPLLAAQAIDRGLADHVLVYFGTDYASEKERESGSPYSYHTEEPLKANLEVPFGWATQPVYLAGHARRHMYEHGTTAEQLGEVVVQTRANASHNEKAQKRTRLSLDDYFDNRVIADPFHVLDCCLVSDGAGAYVLSAAEDAENGPNDPVYVHGVGIGHSDRRQAAYLSQHEDYTSFESVESGAQAFGMAGLEPADVDFAEIYDCFSITTIMQLEDLGFCEKGDGGRFVEEQGITVADGDLPVNTHGGLLSQAYVHGMNHVVEAVRQLRGTADNQVEHAETGIVTGWGGNEHATLILGREAAR